MFGMIPKSSRPVIIRESNGQTEHRECDIISVVHLKGTRFGLPAIQRIGALDDRGVHRVKWNTHPNIEIHYLIKGSFSWEIFRRKKPITVPGGAFVVIPREVRHRAADETGKPSTRIGVICQPPTAANAAGSSLSLADWKSIYSALQKHALEVHGISASLSNLLKETRLAVTRFVRDDPRSQADLRLLCELLLLRTAKEVLCDHPPLREGDVIPRIRAWIEDHLAEMIDINALVSHSGYGRSRFFQLFLAETGMTPSDYIIRRRVDRARQILRSQPDLTMAEISRLCGFKTPTHFSATFRKHVGAAPLTWREKADAPKRPSRTIRHL